MLKDFEPYFPQLNLSPNEMRFGRKPFPDRNVHYITSLSPHKHSTTPKAKFSFLKQYPKEAGTQTPNIFKNKEIDSIRIKIKQTEEEIAKIQSKLKNDEGRKIPYRSYRDLAIQNESFIEKPGLKMQKRSGSDPPNMNISADSLYSPNKIMKNYNINPIAGLDRDKSPIANAAKSLISIQNNRLRPNF
ncbi:unnamed protein product [Blepharisma stoltei]|uniref:Uncharacterized protein n=1 Tax=Blepharisma stoltei TaxID=1481888 RepID=A0AAU9ICX3_9CILI|nr:unnamed protein product [Blepharisma stoltei]